MRKFISVSVLPVLLFPAWATVQAQGLPAKAAKSAVQAGVSSAVTDQAVRAAVRSGGTSAVTGQAVRGLADGVAGAVSDPRAAASAVNLPQLQETLNAAVQTPALTPSFNPTEITETLQRKLSDLPAKQAGFYKRAKVFLTQGNRFSGDPATDIATERMRASEKVVQLEEVVALSARYPNLKKFSEDGMFAKFKYVGPEPSGVPVVKADDFVLMLEGPVDTDLIAPAVNAYPTAQLERQTIGKVGGKVLFVRSGFAEELKGVLEETVQAMQAEGYTLRFGSHEVSDILKTKKVHLHFEKLFPKDRFVNYHLFVDVGNLRLPYNPLDGDEVMTVSQALEELDTLWKLGAYTQISDVQTAVFSALSGVLPMAEGDEAYTQLLKIITGA